MPLGRSAMWGAVLAAFVGAYECGRVVGDSPKDKGTASGGPVDGDGPFTGTDELKRIVPDSDVWVDKKRKRVILRGTICLREGPLELFACLANTKEHEAIVAVATKAMAVHAALLAVGAKPGQPATFHPEYRPASGQIIDVDVYWTDADGKRRRRAASDWVREVASGKALDQHWVFGGSGFWKDPNTGDEYYLGEDGDLICVSNFPTALLDLPVESSQSNEALLYEAFKERIPPVSTKVAVVLTPRQPHPKDSDTEQ